MRARAVTVAATPTLIASGGSTITPDIARIQVPSGGVTVYLGDASVATTTGYAVAAGSSFDWPLVGESIYGVVETGTQAVIVAERGN
jgi:hypothetical protein